MSFPVVAIAASAGGLEALSELLGALPAKSGLAYVVVQHLDPDHDSLLTEILGKRTLIPVQQATDGLRLAPDNVYVIPPNAALTLTEGNLRVGPRALGRQRHMPADILFRSLADTHAGAGIGIVLSGGDSDGAVGIEAIKHAGGITFAQEPDSARFPSMPRHAIDTGSVDFVLRPSEIALELIRLGRHPFLRPHAPAPPAEAEDPAEAITPNEEESLRRIFRRLRSAHGVDFTHYKRSTLRRRIARRMVLQRLEDPADYAALIDSDGTEAAALYQDFLIRVTGFFRDPESFEALTQRIFPSLCEGRSPKDPIRIWVPGCASGEEVYSIAMELMEFLGESPSPLPPRYSFSAPMSVRPRLRRLARASTSTRSLRKCRPSA